MSSTILSVRVHAIPAKMAVERRWVAWRLEMRGNKPTKVPVSPHTGRDASSTRTGDWSTLDHALDCMDRGRFHGIGFVLGDGWAGVDQDHCLDPATGVLEAWALANVRCLDSYTEVSPRGHGVKTIVRGTLPSGRRRKGPIEMYDRARYFTVTGHHLEGTPRGVEERTSALHALHRRVFGTGAAAEAGRQANVRASCASTSLDLRERASRGRIRRTTLDLLDSTGPAGYGSPSEADAAIAAGLIGAGLTADEALAVLLDSARGQDALERKGQRHGHAYWQRTVEHAAGFVGPVVETTHGRVRVVKRPVTRPFREVSRPATRPFAVVGDQTV
jgi:primase-polymerase (primpol)-like protein